MIDQYKVAFDMETIADARPVINKLKLELANFRKIVLLDHHHKPGTKAVIPGVLSYVRLPPLLRTLSYSPRSGAYGDEKTF